MPGRVHHLLSSVQGAQVFIQLCNQHSSEWNLCGWFHQDDTVALYQLQVEVSRPPACQNILLQVPEHNY